MLTKLGFIFRVSFDLNQNLNAELRENYQEGGVKGNIMNRATLMFLGASLAVLLALSFVVSVCGQELGDVDGNGLINIVDALQVARHVAGLNPSPFYENVADVDSSGAINIVDALMIARYCAHLIPVFSIPIENITANPSAWVNKTVAVEGYLRICLLPGWWQPPFNYELSSSPYVSGSIDITDNGTCFTATAIGVSEQNLGYDNKKVMILGIVTTGTWTVVTENGTVPYGPPVYFIEAQQVIVL